MFGWETSVRRTQRRSGFGLPVGENNNSTNMIDLRKKSVCLMEDVTVAGTPGNKEPMTRRDFTYLIENCTFSWIGGFSRHVLRCFRGWGQKHYTTTRSLF